MTFDQFSKVFSYADCEHFPRFVEKIKVAGKCWEWNAYCHSGSRPYGRFRWNGKLWLAHRVAFLWANGFLPDEELQIDHKCNNHRCVNPKHLRPMTNKDNCLRSNSPMAKNARKTHCPKGHLYDEENTCWVRNGTARECRRCRNTRILAIYYKKRLTGSEPSDKVRA